MPSTTATEEVSRNDRSMADTLVTRINDSFLDFDVLGTVDPAAYSVTGESHHSEMVRDVRRKRRQVDGASTDWIVSATGFR
jgi:chromosome partitioning protein